MNIEYSVLKKIIREEIEMRFGSSGTSMLIEKPEFNAQSYRGVSFEVPEADSQGNILSEDMRLLYVDEMHNFLDSFLSNSSKKQ